MIKTLRRKRIKIKRIEKLKNIWDCCYVSSYFRQRSASEPNNLLTSYHTYFSQIQTKRMRCFIRVTPLTCYKSDISVSNKTVSGPGSSVGIATDYGLDGLEPNPGGDENFRPSRPALGPT